MKKLSLFDEMNEEERSSVTAMLANCGMAGLLDIRLERELAQTENLEVWI